jgi:hypothetical protein
MSFHVGGDVVEGGIRKFDLIEILINQKKITRKFIGNTVVTGIRAEE